MKLHDLILPGYMIRLRDGSMLIAIEDNNTIEMVSPFIPGVKYDIAVFNDDLTNPTNSNYDITAVFDQGQEQGSQVVHTPIWRREEKKKFIWPWQKRTSRINLIM